MNKNTIVIEENALESVVCEMAAILSRTQHVKLPPQSENSSIKFRHIPQALNETTI